MTKKKNTKIDEVLEIADQREKTIDEYNDKIDALTKRCEQIINRKKECEDKELSVSFAFDCYKFPLMIPTLVIIKHTHGKVLEHDHINVSIQEGKVLYEMLKEIYEG
jgi:hypothetical protein